MERPCSEKAPHMAILKIQIETHDLLPTGECSGHVIGQKDYDEYGIKPISLVSVKGFDKHDCLMKLKTKLEELRNAR